MGRRRTELQLTQAQTVSGSNLIGGAIFTYDPMGRVTGTDQCTPLNCGVSAFGLSFAYDYLGDTTSYSNPQENATYTYTYDTLARLTTLQSSLSDSQHPGTLLTVNTYNPLNEVTKATLGNGIVRTLGYDNRGRTTSLTDGSIYSFALTFAGDSNILTGNDSINGNWSYTYDDFNRIATSNKNSGQQAFSYAYDRYSNRWDQTVTAGTGPSPQYSFNTNNQNNQITTLTYDAAGNVTNDGTNTYTYDAENRVTSVSGGNSASYYYDAFGRRVRATINSVSYDFIYNNGSAVDEFNGSTWVWGDAGSMQVAAYANSTTYFNHSDWLGSVRAWSNVSGTSVGTCTNLPYGDGQNCTGTQPNSWQYTGLPFDSETGLTHAFYRQLSTTEGRWITTDPAGMAAVDPTNPQSWNRYAYVENTPVNAADPLGLHCPVNVSPPPPGCGGGGDGSDVFTDWGWDNYWAGGGSWGGGFGGGGGGFGIGLSGSMACSDFMPCGLSGNTMQLPCDFGYCGPDLSSNDFMYNPNYQPNPLQLIGLGLNLFPNLFWDSPGPPKLCRMYPVDQCNSASIGGPEPATVSAVPTPAELTQDQINAACMIYAYNNNNGFDQNSSPTAWNANGLLFTQYTQYPRPSAMNPSSGSANVFNILVAPQVFTNADYHRCGGTGYIP
jgi:RHS repeat-associated protein